MDIFRKSLVFVLSLLVLSSFTFAATRLVIGSEGVACLSDNIESTHVTIQEAVDVAAPGDVLVVCGNGVSSYLENVVVDTPLSINGFDSSVSINPLNPALPIFWVQSDDVTISNFTLAGVSTTFSPWGSAIYGTGDNLRVNTIIARDNGNGVYLYGSNNQVSDSTFFNNAVGIILAINTDNQLSNNRLYDNNYGILLDSSSSNNIRNNIAYRNAQSNFILQSGSNRNILDANVANDSSVGFFLIDSSNNNTLSNNIANGNTKGFLLSSSHDNIMLSNIAANNTLHAFHLSGSSTGTILSSNRVDGVLNFGIVLDGRSAATFIGTNVILGPSIVANLIDIRDGSIATAFSGGIYHRIVTASLNFSFENAENVSFTRTTANLLGAGVSPTRCSGGSTCRLVSNILVLTTNGPNPTRLNQLLIYYNQSQLSGSPESGVRLGWYLADGWSILGVTELNTLQDYVRYGSLNTVGIFGAVVPTGPGGGAPMVLPITSSPQKNPVANATKSTPHRKPLRAPVVFPNYP